MAKAVEPFANFPAQELLKNGPSLHGWVRKDEPGRVKSALKLFDWPRRFMILCKGCLYLYKESTDSNFCDKYPLSSYRVCNAQEITKYDWVFKLINAVEVETLYFAVDSEYDLLNWISTISKDKEEYCDPLSGGGTHTGSGYCYIDDFPCFEKGKSMSIAHRQLPPLPEPAAQPLRPHSRSSPGPFVAVREFQWPAPSLESRKTAQRPPPLPPREDSRRHSLPTPSEVPINHGNTAAPHHIPSASRAFPKSPEQFPALKSSRPTPPPKDILRKNASSASSQVNMDLVIRDLRQGLGQSYEPVIPASNGGSSKGFGTPHREGRAITRGHPDGNSFRRPRGLDDVLPPSAIRLDLNKTQVSPLLKNKVGVYILRESQNSQSKRALSVWTGDKVNHYLVFYEQGQGYALAPEKGPRFNSIEKLVRHYFEYNLPNTEVKLTMPYK